MKGGITYDVPSTFYTILFFFVDILIYGVLTWYFDHVDSSNRGKSYSKIFFLQPIYWTGKSQKEEDFDYIDEISELKRKVSTDNQNCKYY